MVSYESPKGDSEALKSQLEGVMGSERAHLLRYAAATAIKTCRSSKSRVYEKNRGRIISCVRDRRIS